MLKDAPETGQVGWDWGSALNLNSALRCLCDLCVSAVNKPQAWSNIPARVENV